MPETLSFPSTQIRKRRVSFYGDERLHWFPIYPSNSSLEGHLLVGIFHKMFLKASVFVSVSNTFVVAVILVDRWG